MGSLGDFPAPIHKEAGVLLLQVLQQTPALVQLPALLTQVDKQLLKKCPVLTLHVIVTSLTIVSFIYPLWSPSPSIAI